MVLEEIKLVALIGQMGMMHLLGLRWELFSSWSENGLGLKMKSFTAAAAATA